jgi:hypothetical protein
MKKLTIVIAVRRLANLFYLYSPSQVTFLIDEYTIPVLAHDLGIFKRDSKQANDFSSFTTQLQFLVDAVHLIDLEGRGAKLSYADKMKEVGFDGLTKKQIKNPILFVWEFFEIFPMRFVRLELHFWLDALLEFKGTEDKLLEKKRIFPFFLALHELIEVSYLLNRYLRSL